MNEETRLIALSNIVGGLLASGSYTYKFPDDADGKNFRYDTSMVACVDWGESFNSDPIGDPFPYRYVPIALQDGWDLLRQMEEAMSNTKGGEQ